MSSKSGLKIRWNLRLNPGGREPETVEEIRAHHFKKWKNAGIQFVRAMTANDRYVCEHCKSFHRRVIPIDQAINGLVFERCASQGGCRCYYQPAREGDE